MRVWQTIVMVAAVTVAVAEAQRMGKPGRRSFRIPSRVEMSVAVNNPETVKKALACIEGLPCRLDDDYAHMLRRWGPEIMMRGHCPLNLCTPEEAREAKWLISKIYEKYPKRYLGTVNRLASRVNPYNG